MASEGPNSPSSVVNDTEFGGVAWTNPGNATASDDSRATVTVDQDQSPGSDLLHADNFGFTIPAGATIDGIVLEFERSVSSGTAYPTYWGYSAKGGTRDSSSEFKLDVTTTTDAYTTLGSATELWGETWTASDINSSDFGMMFYFTTPGFGGTFTYRIDHIRVTVYYTESAGGGSVPMSRVARFHRLRR